MKYYLNCFFIYSILGFLMESMLYIILGNGGQSGFLYGPWTPVYGFGVIFIIGLSDFIFQKYHFKAWIKYVILFFSAAILLSFIEFVGGVLLESIFHVVLWNYSGLMFHIGPYIALEMSLIWGGSAVLFTWLIKPWSEKVLKKMPIQICYMLSVLLLVDLVLTCIFPQ